MTDPTQHDHPLIPAEPLLGMLMRIADLTWHADTANLAETGIEDGDYAYYLERIIEETNDPEARWWAEEALREAGIPYDPR